MGERGLLDLILYPARLDRGDRPAQLVDLGDQLARQRRQLVGQRLDVVAPRERIRGLGRAGLGRKDLLGAKGDGRAALGGKRERLVKPVGVEALGASADRGERLHGNPHDVVLGLLGGQGRSPGLSVKPQHQ